MQSWITNGNKYTYRIELLEDMLSNGKSTNSKKIDYYTVIKEEDNYYLNIDGFVEKNELNKYTNAELELTKNMAVLLYDAEDREKFDFPNNKAISDIVLLVNNNILDKVTNEKLTLNDDETVTVSREQISRIIKETKQEYFDYFSKFYKEMPINNFINEVISYMIEYDFLREYETGYKIYPAISKLIGYIPKEKDEQLNLFGGRSYE